MYKVTVVHADNTDADILPILYQNDMILKIQYVPIVIGEFPLT